jgi:RHS repeat-associated protein
VRRLVDGSDTITDAYNVDAFGNLRSSTGTTPNPYRFGGAWGYMTDPSGLLQPGHRFYRPEVARFIQQDPISYGMNWYAYVGNNPLYWVDPEGLWDPDVHWRWAKTAAATAGFNDLDARRIAQAAHDIDNVRTLGREPHYGDRQDYANRMAQEGIDLWHAGKRREALERWGRGAHALEDEYAHRDISKLDHVIATIFNFFTGNYNIEDPVRLRPAAQASRNDTLCYFKSIKNRL